jgi:hypothetical protein
MQHCKKADRPSLWRVLALGFTISTKAQAEDLVRGATFFGTGGGGSPEEGLKSLYSEIDAGRDIKVIDVHQVKDDDWTACPYLMGSIAPLTQEKMVEMRFYGLSKSKYTDRKTLLGDAFRELSHYVGKEITVVVPIGLGGVNTPAPLAMASSLGISSADGDYTGRALPEIAQTTPFLNGKKVWPIASVDEYGNTSLIKETINPLMAERIGKLISVASYGLVGQCGFLMKGSDLKKVVIKNTITECREIGQVIREARENGKRPLEEVAKSTRGWILFKGIVVKKEDQDRDGYYWGTHTVEGLEEYRGHSFKIWFKNENHMSWLDEKPYVMSPDLIEVISLETGEPITNNRLSLGTQVGVVGMKAREVFRSDKGLEILGPKHFGFQYPYKPIEELAMK